MNAWSKRLAVAAGISASLVGLSSEAARAADLTIAVFGGVMGNTIRSEYAAPFARKEKLDVAVDERDWGVGAVRARVESGGNSWDVVSAEDIEVLQGCQEGIFVELDMSKISGLEKIADPRDKSVCGVPQNIYSVLLAYDRKRLKEAPTSWADFWDTTKWPGKRSMQKSPRGALEIALMADGVPREKIYEVLASPQGVDRAFRKLDALKPNMVWWDNAGQSRQLLSTGETVMTATFDSVNRLNLHEGGSFGTVTRDAIRYVDYFSVIAATPHMDAAYKFLDYSNRPEPQAAMANKIAIAGPNVDALALVDAKVLPGLSTNPDIMKRALRSDVQFWLDNFDSLNKRFEAWAAR